MDVFLLLEVIFLSFGNEMEIEIPAISGMTELINRGKQVQQKHFLRHVISEGKYVCVEETNTHLSYIYPVISGLGKI